MAARLLREVGQLARLAARSRVATGRARRDTEFDDGVTRTRRRRHRGTSREPAGADEPVTVLYSRRMKPGREADFEAWAHDIVAAARQFPGTPRRLGAGRPGSREYHILFNFADGKSLRAGWTPPSAAASSPGWISC